MSGSSAFKVRIPSQCHRFFTEKTFFDCVLVTSQCELQSHRIFLAASCKWFYTYFKDNPGSHGTIQRITLPCDPNNLFSDFLEFLYSGEVLLKRSVLPSFLKMAVFYQNESAAQAIRIILSQYINESTVLFYANEFLKFDLEEDAAALSSILSLSFRSLLAHPYTSTSRLTIDGILDVISPKMLAAILQRPDLAHIQREKETIFTDDFKIKYVDSYALNHPILDEESKESLASVFDWTAPTAYYHLINHKCDWLPARIARPLYRKIIENRAGLTRLCAEQFDRVPDKKISRWYPLMWFNHISAAKSSAKMPKVKLVHFIKTMGGLIAPVNPQMYRFADTFCNATPISPLFDSRFIFERGSYFQARASKQPGGAIVGIDLGPSAQFVPRKVDIDCHIVKTTMLKTVTYSAYPTKLSVKGAQEPSLVPAAHGHKIQMASDIVKGKHFNVKKKEAFRCLAIQMKPKTLNINGGDLWKLNKIEFCGTFVA